MTNSQPKAAWTCLELLFVAVAVLCTALAQYPLLYTFFSVRIIGGVDGDAGLYIWLVTSFIHDPLQALQFETPGLYPYPLTRGWSDNFLLPSAFVQALVSLGISFTQAYNVMLLGCLSLNGVATYMLCRSLAATRLGALIAALLLANSSYLLGNLGHPQLIHFFWIPASLALCFRAASFAPVPVGSQPMQHLHLWIAAGLCIAGAFYSAVYYAVFCGLVVGFVALFSGQSFKNTALSVGLICFGASPCLWGVIHYLPVKEAFDGRALYEAAAFSATGLSYLSFSNLNFLFGKTSGWTHPEATLASGYLALLSVLLLLLSSIKAIPRWLAATIGVTTALCCVSSSMIDQGTTSEFVTCVAAWVLTLGVVTSAALSRKPRVLLLCLCLGFFVLSLGPGGNPDKREPAFAPFSIFYAIIPGLDSVRAVSRCGVIPLLGIYIGVGLLASRLLRKPSVRPLSLAGYASVACIALGTLAENHQAALPLDPLPAKPAIFNALKEATKHVPGAALVLPYANRLERGEIASWTEFATINTRVATWSVGSAQAVVNGYSGQQSRLMAELPKALADFPSRGSIARLSGICGLRYVIILRDLSTLNGFSDTEARLADFVNDLKVLSRDDRGNLLLELLPQPLSALPDPLYAPRGARIRVEGSPACDLTVSEWIRSEIGTVSRLPPVTLRAQESFSSGTRWSGRPFVFSLKAPTCSGPVVCRVSP